VEWQRKEFSIVDTGGLSPGADEHFLNLSKAQADVAIGQASLIILLVDAQSGLLPDDQALARKVRSSGKPVLLVINKAEASRRETNEFARLGFGEPFPISAEHNEGIGDLLDLICKLVKAPEIKDTDPNARPIRVALVGRTNVGKSSMLNRLVGEERSIVSPVSGGTPSTPRSCGRANPISSSTPRESARSVCSRRALITWPWSRPSAPSTGPRFAS
jgi:GTP-binding protein